MPPITPHVCRHTFCSNMAKSGMNPKMLQYIMGHSDISVTTVSYTHLMDNGIRSIAFPSISTGVYSFPVELAAKIAVHTVNRFLQDKPDWFDLVEWVLFDTHTESVYESEVDKIY